MIKTDAYWDTRNLGVSCAEVKITNSDSTETLQDLILFAQDYEHITVKIPAGKVHMVTQLENIGYRFKECLIELAHDLKNIPLEGLALRFDAAMSHEHILAENEEEVYQEIRKGLFQTDRIFLDPCFSREQAENRYINWIKDEIERGAELFRVLYKDQAVGFFAYKTIENNIAYPFLASLNKDKQSTGLGLNLVAEALKEAIARNCKGYTTYVSSNNPPILRVHEYLGFKTRDIIYVLTKSN